MKRINALKKSVLLVLALSVLLVGCTTQMVRFETIPDKADIYINGIPQGKAPVTAKLVTDSFLGLDPAQQKFMIVAKMDGYEDKQLDLVSHSFIYNDPEPFPGTIKLRLRRTWPDGYNAELRKFQPVARQYRESRVKPSLPEEARKCKVQADFAIEQKRFEDASDRYADALNICPWWPEGHFNRALILVMLKRPDYKEAVMEMKKYLMLVPNAPDARAAQDKIYQWESMVK